MTISRRAFVARAGASAAGLILLPCLKEAGLAARAFNGMFPAATQVGITRADTYARAVVRQKVQHLFDAIGGLGDIAGSGDRVAIKINITGGSGVATSPYLGGRPITESMWTHPEVLRAVGELLIDAGVSGNHITVVEALWDSASYTDFGYLEVQQSLGAGLVNLNTPDPYTGFFDLPVGTGSCYYSSFTVNRILDDCNVFVSIPKMKEHYEAGVTASLKNQIGMVPKHLYVLPGDTGRRAALHSEGGASNTHLPRSIADLNLARPVHLAVIDGIRNARGGEGVWNPTFRVAEDNVLLAGKDPVAADSLAAWLMGHDPEGATLRLPGGGQCDSHLELLRQRGGGTNRMDEIQPVGDGAGLVTSVPSGTKPGRPSECRLYQNYPNPFNPSTTLSFSLHSSRKVSVRIFTTGGQLVETLFDGQLPGGIHEIRWSPAGIASGAYICEMRSGPFVERLKLLYQK